MEDETLENLLLQNAALVSKIRRKIRTMNAGEADPGKYYVYTLLLQNDNVYVGATDNIFSRIMDHFFIESRTSQWVREHGPPKRVLEIVENAQPTDETYFTLKWMSMLGWQSVRGANWCRIALKGPPAALLTFERSRNGFRYMSREKIDTILENARLLAEEENAMQY
jgi:predicted GIY-YIG superfamily endonuclease